MIRQVKKFAIPVFILATLWLSAFQNKSTENKTGFKFPYKKAGLTEKEAAAYLLSRFTFGAKPGEVDAVVAMGLENWFAQQLEGKLPESDSLTNTIAQYPSLKMSNEEIVDKYPRNGQVISMMVRDGLANKDSLKSLQNSFDRKEVREMAKRYMEDKGLKPEAELYRELINQKIIRAAYSNNQLHELLTDFWFNHFNVSLTKNDCAQLILSYERDCIRPNVTGKFNDILLATAKSPAMLVYLDNFKSVASNNVEKPGAQAFRDKLMMDAMNSGDTEQVKTILKFKKNKNSQGLNENYAREVMELHTLGVDGGYTQSDVTQAARIFTGWTIWPTVEYRVASLKRIMEKLEQSKYEKIGFVHDGDFLFNANKHDTGQKVVLGKVFPPKVGYEEGVQLLQLLAHHPSTARFISNQLATRFVSDNPNKALVAKMAKTFLNKDGDLKEVMITMATAPEFWSNENIREKIKSPFELAISTLRSVDAHIGMPYQIFNWVNRMGQKMYYYQAPTGFPDRGQYWINTGSLLNRMNFGLALATERIPGVSFNLVDLNNHHEPESAEAALKIYSKIMMPERNLDLTIKRLLPFINDTSFTKKISEASVKTPPPAPVVASETMMGGSSNDMMMESSTEKKEKLHDKPNRKNDLSRAGVIEYSKGNNTLLANVVGIIIGSPEYQRK